MPRSEKSKRTKKMISFELSNEDTELLNLRAKSKGRSRSD